MEYHEICDKEEKTSFQNKYYFMLNNERIDNDIRISNEFKNYFVPVCSTLASKINDNSCNLLDYIQSNVQSMVIPNYNENDVTLVINSLNNSSPGWDDIPALIAKQVISYMELSNYRPISVLIFSSKVKNLMYNSLVSYFDKYNILYQNQFGFRQGHSSRHALITLVNKITKFRRHGDWNFSRSKKSV